MRAARREGTWGVKKSMATPRMAVTVAIPPYAAAMPALVAFWRCASVPDAC